MALEGRRIQAVTFDAGGTLLEPWPSVGQVYADAIREAGFGALDPAALDQAFYRVWSEQRSFDYTQAGWAAVVACALEGLTPAGGDPRLFSAVWERFAQPEAWRIFPEVIPCLNALNAAGIRCAVVSNWDERLGPLLRAVGLAPYFEFILPSVEAAAPKPDPRIFQQASRRLGLPSAVILHVGDRMREDVGGARSAGLQAVRVGTARAGAESTTIRTLAELPAWLGFR